MKTCSVEGCARKILARGFCAPHYSTWHRQQRKYTIVCGHCGRTVQAQRPRAKYCSKTCGALAHTEHASAGQRAQVAQRAAQRAARRLPVLYDGPPFQRQPKRPPKPIKGRKGRYFAGTCKVCDYHFVSPMPSATCSMDCQTTYFNQMRRIAKDRRRSRERDAYVENVYRKQVFKRDGYRCHLCCKKVDPTKQVPHPKAPTLDHIIPLACGGKHEPSNCRTACFRCNSTKGDRGGGEQLLLIA